MKSWRVLPAAAFRRQLAPSVNSFKSISRHGSGASFSTSNTLKWPIFTQLLVCSDEPLWPSKPRRFLVPPEHGVLLPNARLAT